MNMIPDNAALMQDFSTAFGGVIFFWLLGLCVGAVVKTIR